jgi:hypothetical protein
MMGHQRHEQLADGALAVCSSNSLCLCLGIGFVKSRLGGRELPQWDVPAHVIRLSNHEVKCLHEDAVS